MIATEHWLAGLTVNPIPSLTAAANPAVAYFARRDLLGLRGEGIETVWALPAVQRIIRHQLASGTWPISASARAGPNPAGHGLVEAYRHLRVLVDQYELDRRHEAVARAVEYVFSHQTAEGDVRGILANQYAPYYTGALLGLAARAGYADDPRVEMGITWLLFVRQDDGGWAPGSPGMIGISGLRARDTWKMVADPTMPTARAFARSRPSSASATGMAIRALAANPGWQRSDGALAAGRFLKSMMLRKDYWPSYRHEDNWVRFAFPFWWTNLISALDALSLLGFGPDDLDVARGLAWLAEHQGSDGLWLQSYSRIHRTTTKPPLLEQQLWITLAICRLWRRFFAAAC